MRELKTYLLAGLSFLPLLSSPALAEERFALARFHPTFAGDRLLGVPTPNVSGHLRVHAMLLVDYARNPLLESSDLAQAPTRIVDRQAWLSFNVTTYFWNRAAVNIVLPFAVAQTGVGTTSSPIGGFLGDLRLGLRTRIFGRPTDALQMGMGTYFWLPTGNGSYLTDGFARQNLHLTVGGVWDNRFVWSVALGPELRRRTAFAESVPIGAALAGGAGLGLIFGASGQVQISGELVGSQVLRGGNESSFYLEALVHGRYRVLRPIEIGFGMGGGISQGIGTPSYRAIGTVTYAPPLDPPPADQDGDGIPDVSDHCPRFAGESSRDPSRNGCPSIPSNPPLTRDDDGAAHSAPSQ